MVSINIPRARSLMQSSGIDGIIASTLENNFYLSGMWNESQDMFPLDSESYTVASADAPDRGVIVCSIGGADLTLLGYPTLTGVETFGTFFRDVVDGVELDADEERVRQITVAHETGRSALEAIVASIEKLGLADGTVAVDERGPNRALIEQLSERLPGARFVPGAALFRSIRAVKTDEEIERVTAALRVTEAGLRACYDAFEVGVTELQLKTIFETTVASLGARPGFMLVRFGKGLALGQVPASDIPLKAGDFVFFDIGVNLDGYKSDIGRLVSFGEPSAELESLYAASKAGQQTAIDMMKPGVVAKDVFNAAVQCVIDEGIPTYKRQHVGHGIGIEYYDLPVITPSADTVLEANMTFEVETPYYRLGVGGAFIEDTVIVRPEGSEIITTLERELQVIEVR